MAPFLHLSLLLGTIQLFVVLATYVSCQDWKIERCCWFKNNQTTCESSDIDIEKNNKKVHIKNFKQQGNDYQLCCYTTSKLKLNLCKVFYLSDGANGVKVHFLDSNFTGKLKLEYKCGGQLDLEVKNSCSGGTCVDVSLIRPHNATITVQPPMNCDGKTNGDGNKKALKFYRERKSWIDALLHCEREKTILVQITNQTVERAVSTLLTNKTLLKDGVWVGLERPIFGCDVTWKWTSKINFNVSHWDGSFPVNRSNYHCGKIILIKETQEFKFVDGYCHEELPFICQGFTEILLESNGGSSYP